MWLSNCYVTLLNHCSVNLSKIIRPVGRRQVGLEVRHRVSCLEVFPKSLLRLPTWQLVTCHTYWRVFAYHPICFRLARGFQLWHKNGLPDLILSNLLIKTISTTPFTGSKYYMNLFNPVLPIDYNFFFFAINLSCINKKR